MKLSILLLLSLLFPWMVTLQVTAIPRTMLLRDLKMSGMGKSTKMGKGMEETEGSKSMKSKKKPTKSKKNKEKPTKSMPSKKSSKSMKPEKSSNSMKSKKKSMKEKSEKKVKTQSPLPSPTLYPTMVPTQAPSTTAPTTTPTQAPSTTAPTQVPSTATPTTYPTDDYGQHDDDIDSTMPLALITLAPTSSPTTFGNACRCDDQGNCLATPLPQGMNLTLCVFTQAPYELLSIDRFSLVQGETIVEILPGRAPNETVRFCTADMCVLEADVDDSFYGVNETASLTALGVAILKPALRRQLALRTEMDFVAEVTLAASAEQVVDDTGNSRGDADGGVDGDLDSVGDGDGSNKVVSWLFPLLLILVVAGICVYLVIRKRQQAGGSHSSSI